MHRRNKSKKVPNVKLRPAPVDAFKIKTKEQCWVEESQAGSDDTFIEDRCPRPFKGFVICATGVKDKPTLFKKAAELGASYVANFTDRVTHLVAESHGGPKYACALQRKIPIMQPSWIEMCHETWLHGDDVNMEESLTTHRLPVFSGIVLCLSGITDVERRMQINKLVTQHGGTYVKQLERPVKVTHLLCSGDEETEKMRYAGKFNQRQEASIHLVWEEWFWDSLEFGGRFDESTYQVNRPRPERKVHIENPSSPPLSSTLPSENGESPLQSGALADQRTSSSSLQDDDEELTSVKALPAVTLQIWGSLLHRRGYQVSGTELVRTTSAPAAFSSMEGESTSEPLSKPGESVIAAFRRVNSSFTPMQVISDESDNSTRRPFKRVPTSANIFSKSEAPLQEISENMKEGQSPRKVAPPVAGPSSKTAEPNKMFNGLKFSVLGEAKTPAVKEAIESHGGSLTDKFDEEVDYIIVRLVSGSKIFREESDQTLRSKYRTECWLERCIFEDKVCPPDQDITFMPLAIKTPVTGAENIIMSLSGFDQSESCGLRRLLRALGITLANSFSRQTTHLLCPSGTGLKFQKACEWRITVVKVSWLASMAATGITPPVQDHLVSGSVVTSDSRNDALMELDVKGKGKAKAVLQDIHINVTSKMTDITNADVLELPHEHPHRSDAPEAKRPRTRLVEQTSLSSSTLSFGKPKAYLGGSAPAKAPSIASLPPGSNTAPSHPLSQFESVSQEYPALNSSYSNTRLHEIPKPSWQEIEKEKLTARIPSSRTPSPMKATTNEGKAGNRSSSSPVKIDHEATRALQESITRALKRHTSEEDEILGDGRNPKRLRKRPQRHNKVPSRQTSDKQISDVPSDLDIIPLMPFAVSSTSPFDSFDDPSPELGEQELIPQINGESEVILGTRSRVNMRVLYEDPGQADERKKLMSLLKTQSQNDDRGPDDTGETRRRSTRTRKTTKTDGR